ncbi:MAG: enoyl-CoA hydratase/isomerase family protein [Pseudomonadota bacterium]
MHRNKWEYLSVERDGRVAIVRFDSKNKVNSLSLALMRELTQLATELQTDAELSAVILTGQSTVFSGGMDLKDPELASAGSLSLAQRRELVKVGPRMCAAWEGLEPVTLAAIEGWCIGGAVALAVACDWRVAASTASIRVPEIKLGFNMSWQSVPRFVNLIGPAKTKQLLLLADVINAEAAQQWGLLDYVVESGSSMSKAKALAEQLADMPPVPLRMIKQAINLSASALDNAVSAMDVDQFLLAMGSEDAAEAARAFFENREAVFTGR